MTPCLLVPNYDKPLRMLIIGSERETAEVVELMNRKSGVWWRAVPLVREEVKEKRA